ncbi:MULTISPECIES: hemolysin family protein [Actinokineospora]|uniref:Membrane protein n=1 Tax=Actinokineospora fastidiosa TaxID=1816 RepID=A0A918LGC2_9PSEU|nr:MULTISPECIES: hemolysin family protein [Actinokineospora]UVS78522.1 Magnesium and cobalt efflux protein CorC [Actinokineospora sp. UTMC 2448]GGS45109.1 membrane protein [Actinokineospora fastidiosa]
MSVGWALAVSLLLLVGNAFFVAAEFALTAAKRYRLEDDAAAGSRAARAAIAGIDELSVMLAGAQLGITLCTLGLGALAKPAVAELTDPLLQAVGLPTGLSYGIAFALSLVIVVFLHMVVGEMAPKSWAIAHPETSARMLALPFRWFTRSVRWLLSGLNHTANAMLRLVKVNPRDALAHSYGAEDLRMLVRQSGEHGTIPEGQQRLLTRMLALQNTTLAQVMIPRDKTVTVTEDHTAREVEKLSHLSGRSRFPVMDAGGRVTGLIHVREAMRATAAGVEVPARDLMGDVLLLPATEPVAAAVTTMRAHRAQLALVTADDGAVVGIAALEDLLEELIGEFDDETDTPTRS